MVPINPCQCQSPAVGTGPDIIPEWKTRPGWLCVAIGRRQEGFQEGMLSGSMPGLQGGAQGGHQAFAERMGCRSGRVPRGKWTEGGSCLLWSCSWQAAPRMRSVHLISRQELARAESLSSENCFHVSCSWHPGDCSVRRGSDPLPALHPEEEKLATCSTADVLKTRMPCAWLERSWRYDHLGAPLATP